MLLLISHTPLPYPSLLSFQRISCFSHIFTEPFTSYSSFPTFLPSFLPSSLSHNHPSPFLVVSDPAFLVSRSHEDFLTWVDSSKIKRAVMKYNDKLDDFDLLGN